MENYFEDPLNHKSWFLRIFSGNFYTTNVDFFGDFLFQGSSKPQTWIFKKIPLSKTIQNKNVDLLKNFFKDLLNRKPVVFIEICFKDTQNVDFFFQRTSNRKSGFFTDLFQGPSNPQTLNKKKINKRSTFCDSLKKNSLKNTGL